MNNIDFHSYTYQTLLKFVTLPSTDKINFSRLVNHSVMVRDQNTVSEASIIYI